MKPMTLRELEKNFWRRYADFLKGCILVLSAILFLVALAINFPSGWIAYGLKILAEKIEAWQPVKPDVFNIPLEE